MIAKTNPGFYKKWQDIGQRIGLGLYSLNKDDLLEIGTNLDTSIVFHDVYSLVGSYSYTNSDRSARKKLALQFTEKLWGITSKDWLRKEKRWLREAKESTKISLPKGIDYVGESLSAEILSRIFTASMFVKKLVEDTETRPRDISILRSDAVASLGIFLTEVCAKGRGYTTVYRDRFPAIYLEGWGIVFGSDKIGLPYPEIILPKLLIMLHKSKINPKIYIPPA